MHLRESSSVSWDRFFRTARPAWSRLAPLSSCILSFDAFVISLSLLASQSFPAFHSSEPVGTPCGRQVVFLKALYRGKRVLVIGVIRCFSPDVYLCAESPALFIWGCLWSGQRETALGPLLWPITWRPVSLQSCKCRLTPSVPFVIGDIKRFGRSRSLGG